MQIGTDWKGIVLAKIVNDNGEYKMDYIDQNGQVQKLTHTSEQALIRVAQEIHPNINWIDK